MPVDRERTRVSSVSDHRWETQTYERTVLAIVRTRTSAIRLLDALSLLGTDARVGIRIAFDDSSAFSGDVPEFLRAAGIRFTLLSDIVDVRFDLAVMASENIELANIDMPIIVLPHGTGFHRFVPDSVGRGYRLAGVVPESRLRGKEVWIAVPHPAQRDQLARDYPTAAARCVVVGDIVFDQLAASLPRRDQYRRALGVHHGQRLVVVTSTWGDGSLFKSWPGLPAHLLGELPADEYMVALVLHPNIWADLGDYLLRLRLRDARRAGLALLPPMAGWQAGLVAADAVIGDHGSVTMYAAALDRPVLLTGDRAAARVLPGTPPDELAGMTGRLNPALPPEQQIEAVIESHKPGQGGAIADLLFARQGNAAQALRDLLYDKLNLRVPDAAPMADAANSPDPERTESRSFLVHARISPDDLIRLWRLPAAVRNGWAAPADAVSHLCVDEEDPDPRRLGNASVIVRRTGAEPAEADTWLTDTFQRYPGCRVAALPHADGCLLGLADGTRVRVTAITDASLAGSAVYARLRLAERLPGRLTIQTGSRSFETVIS